MSKHVDKSGTYDLDAVDAVTPYNTTETIADIHRPGQKVTQPRIVGQLHFKSGQTLTTDTEYNALVTLAFGEDTRKS